MADFNIYKCLWAHLNDVVCPPASCLLLEMPGYSVNPDIFDMEVFRANESAAMSPSYATAMLVDRVPALAPCFYDTGFCVSSYWKQLIETLAVPSKQLDNPDLRGKYDEAIMTLYGRASGWVNLNRSECFRTLDALRNGWYAARQQQCEELYYYKEKEDDAFLEYTSMKSQINQHQAAILEYTRRDPNQVLLKHRQVLGQKTLFNAGTVDTGAPFLQTSLSPKSWWKWFKDNNPTSDDGWTQVIIRGDELCDNQCNMLSQLTAEEHVKSHFKSHLIFGESGSSNLMKYQRSFTSECSRLTFSFKVRRVAIDRPWWDTSLLQRTDIGISGVKARLWSSGELDIKNNGVFPLLTTHIIVAKDIEISANKDDGIWTNIFKLVGEENLSGGDKMMSIACFTIMGNFSSNQHARAITCEYESSRNTIKVNGAQIIGWVCTVLPKFPAISMDNQNEVEVGSIAKAQSLLSKQRYLHTTIVWPGTAGCSEVFLYGSFNNWKEAVTMMDKSNNGVYTKSILLPSGLYEYKFLIDGEWCHDPHMPTKEDGFGGLNNVLLIDLNKCDTAVHTNIWSGSSDDNNVFLCGSFNDWRTSVTQMEKTSSGKFRTSVMLSPGIYEYKVYVDGQWFHDPYKPTKDDGFGGLNNILYVDHDPCVAVVHTISWPDVDNPDVFLSGSFNNWKTSVIQMHKNEVGIFTTSITLSPGTYEYKFISLQQWFHDPNQPTTDDGFGGFNNVINVKCEGHDGQSEIVVSISSKTVHELHALISRFD